MEDGDFAYAEEAMALLDIKFALARLRQPIEAAMSDLLCFVSVSSKSVVLQLWSKGEAHRREAAT
jgi:hypothetical protein